MLLDGSIGNYLEVKYPDLVDLNSNQWTNNFNNNENKAKLEALYIEYLNKGVDILTTNTFRTNVNLNKEQVISSIETVKSAIIKYNNKNKETRTILIAGSNPPAEDCYQTKRTLSYEKLKDNHINHINLLHHNGVDFILNETQSYLDELEIINKHCFNNNIKYSVSLYIKENKNNKTSEFCLLDNTPITKAIGYIDSFDMEFIGFNCISVKLFNSLLKRYHISAVKSALYSDDEDNYNQKCNKEVLVKNNNWGVYLNNYEKEDINWKQIYNGCSFYNPIVMGGCCYIYPEDISKLFEVIEKNK